MGLRRLRLLRFLVACTSLSTAVNPGKHHGESGEENVFSPIAQMVSVPFWLWVGASVAGIEQVGRMGIKLENITGEQVVWR